MKSFTEAQREQRLKDLADTFDQKAERQTWHKPVEQLLEYRTAEIEVSDELKAMLSPQQQERTA